MSEHLTHNIDGKHPIIFLDGNCVFCQKSAQWIHRLDKQNRIRFAPLQGKTANMIPEKWKGMDSNADTAVLAEFHGTDVIWWQGSDAILRVFKLLGGIYSVLWFLHFIPSCLRNFIYRWISRNRYRTAGKQAQCSIPDKQFRDKMLP